MSSAPLSSTSLPQLPQQLKVTLPPFNLPDCPDGGMLAGDYVLEACVRTRNLSLWELQFDPVCGYSKLVAIVDTSRMQVILSGEGSSITWGVDHKNRFAQSLDLALLQSSASAMVMPPHGVLRSGCAGVCCITPSELRSTEFWQNHAQN